MDQFIDFIKLLESSMPFETEWKNKINLRKLIKELKIGKGA